MGLAAEKDVEANSFEMLKHSRTEMFIGFSKNYVIAKWPSLNGIFFDVDVFI